MPDAFICDYIRTPIGRFGGCLSSVRTDDLGAVPLRALAERNRYMDLNAIDEVILGCANQSGEDNRNVARMSLLLAGYPEVIPATTINRLCGSGLDAINVAARAIKSGESNLLIAGGVESMSRAPFVMPKATMAFSRANEVHDTTLGWRFINPVMKAQYGVDSMPETAENVAQEFNVSRFDQDSFALRSQRRAQEAIASGRLAEEIVPVEIAKRKGDTEVVIKDEHPRCDTTADSLGELSSIVGADGTVTAGNASGVNDGSAALIIASQSAINQHRLTPIARIVGGAAVGVAPRVMGLGPVPASKKLMMQLGLQVSDFDVIEFNEAFASQCLASLRCLSISDTDPRVNMNGGAIALGHPLGMSGVRIAGSAAIELRALNNKRALVAMCVGVGQGIAMVLESV